MFNTSGLTSARVEPAPALSGTNSRYAREMIALIFLLFPLIAYRVAALFDYERRTHKAKFVFGSTQENIQFLGARIARIRICIYDRLRRLPQYVRR